MKRLTLYISVKTALNDFDHTTGRINLHVYGSGYDVLSTEFKRNLNIALANVPILRW